MDGFELNKIMGAVLGTLLFMLSLSIVTGGLFSNPVPAKAGYEIAAADPKEAKQKGPAEPVIPFANLLAEASPDKGASIARQCVACHDFAKGGPNKVGPELYGVVNRPVASAAGFNYSAPMKAKGGNWTIEALDKFLENPSKTVPGTSMTFLGVRRATDRAALIVYLNKNSDKPADLPKPEAAAAPQGEKKEANPAQPQNPKPDGTGQTK